MEIYIIGNLSKILKTYVKNKTYMMKCVVTERDPVTETNITMRIRYEQIMQILEDQVK